MKCSETLVVSITAAALCVSESLSDEQIELLSAAATQFADTLSTILTARACGEKDTSGYIHE